MINKEELYFVLLRYFNFFLQALRGFALAYYLGPFLFGVFGYIMLYQQYLSYTNIGIQYSVNAELALITNSESQEVKKKRIIDSAFSLTSIISVFLLFIAFLIYFNKIELFPFEGSYKYSFILISLTILTHFQQIFVNILRIEKKIKEIILSDIIISLSILSIILFFDGVNLVNAVFYVWAIVLACVVLYFKFLYSRNINFTTDEVKLLLKVGLPLLIYNFSYYLMGLILRTLVGLFYPTIIMGYFSFANNITTAVMLGLDTITWVIFPSVIAKLAAGSFNNLELRDYLISFTNKLVVIVFTVIFASLLVLPLLFLILPQYKMVEYSLSILLINQIIFNSAFAMISLCIARKMYLQIAIISLLSVTISGTMSLLFSIYHFNFIWLAVSNIIGSLIFINILILFITKKINISYSSVITSFSWSLQLALLISVIAAVLELYYIVVLVLLIVIISRFKILKEIYSQLSILIINKN